jgi:Fanconi anemia group I protein
VFTHCVDLLNSDQLQSQTAQELVGKLLVEVESLSESSMVRVAEQLIDCVKRGTVENGRSLELFPKLLSVISAQPHIRHQRGNAN